LGNKFASEEDFFGFFVCLWAIYMRENLTGPSIYTIYVDEVKRPLDSDAPLKDTPLDFLTLKNEELQTDLLNHFSVDSERMYARSNFLPLFFTMQ